MSTVPIPPILSLLIGHIAAAVPRRARITFTELLIGAAAPPPPLPEPAGGRAADTGRPPTGGYRAGRAPARLTHVLRAANACPADGAPRRDGPAEGHPEPFPPAGLARGPR